MTEPTQPDGARDATCPWDLNLNERCPKHGGPLKDCPVAEEEDAIRRIFGMVGMKK